MQDQIDISTVRVENSPQDIARWPITARLTEIDIRPDGVYPVFDKADSWPEVPFQKEGEPLQFTLWIVIDTPSGKCMTGAIEFWKGLSHNGGPLSQCAANWYYDPGRWPTMAGVQPATGEVVGLFVAAGDHRNNGAIVSKERSQVLAVRLPAGDNGTFLYSDPPVTQPTPVGTDVPVAVGVPTVDNGAVLKAIAALSEKMDQYQAQNHDFLASALAVMKAAFPWMK